MARLFLTQLSIEGFRGINNQGDPLVIKFKRDAVNSLFAANGSGKSSIYESLHYAFYGTVPRLKDMHADEHPDDYVTNLFHTGREATISLSLSPDDGTPEIDILIKRTTAGLRQVSSPSGHPDPDALLASLAQEFALLDYGTFSRFIADTALVRGRSFSSLLGLSDYANFRQTLKHVTNTQSFKADFETPALEAQRIELQANKDRASQRYVSHFKHVTGIDLTDLSTIDDSTTTLLETLRSLTLLAPYLEGKTLADINFSELNLIVQGAEGGDAQSELTQLVTERQTWSSPSIDEAQVRDDVSRIADGITEYTRVLAETKGAHTNALLRAADAFLSADPDWPLDRCPLCDSTLATPIDDHVHNALESFAAEEAAKASLRKEVMGSDYLATLEALEALPNVLEAGEAPLAPSIRSSVLSSNLTTDILESGLTRVIALKAKAADRVSVLSQRIEQLSASLPPSLVALTNQIASAESARSEYGLHAEAGKQQQRVTQKLRQFAEWKTFLGKAHDVFAEAEANHSRKVLDDLKTDYQKLFKGIMGVGDIVPSLARTGSGEKLQVELADFHGHQDVSARALLSESYRNALAISVFLSAALKHSKSPRFVVLDDITSSFDSGHQYFLMEQIRSNLQYPNNPDGLQFILFSHDVTLEKYFDRLNGTADWHHQKLHGQPPLTPVSTHAQGSDRLRAEAIRLISAGEIESGATLIRQYLEYILMQVIRVLKIPVPMDLAVNDHKKMMSGCVDAILAAVQLHEQAGSLVLSPQQVTDLVSHHSPSIISNWVSHYATAASAMFSAPALLHVIADIDSLRQCFQYDSTGSGDWKYYKSLRQRT